ncbi:MAG: hypothetical protein AAFU79_34960, partial [Myxococcota bacterium]
MNLPTDAPQALFPALYILSTALLVVGLPLFVVEVIRLIRDKRFDRDRFRAMATSAFCLVPATLVELGLGGALEVAFDWLSQLALFDITTTGGTAIG